MMASVFFVIQILNHKTHFLRSRFVDGLVGNELFIELLAFFQQALHHILFKKDICRRVPFIYSLRVPIEFFLDSRLIPNCLSDHSVKIKAACLKEMGGISDFFRLYCLPFPLFRDSSAVDLRISMDDIELLDEMRELIYR